MADTPIYCNSYYEVREKLVIEQIGEHLDRLRKNISQLYSPCIVRLMNALPPKGITIDELLALQPNQRQSILSAILYNDALWRMEAAYLMLCIGMLNVAYSNLRSCLESVVNAHIVENLDTEAVKFLKNGEIEPKKISPFIPESYDDSIVKIKETLGNWGVHSSLASAQLSIIFGPSAFDKMIAQTKTKRTQILDESFTDAAITCIRAFGDIFLIFMWLESKGTIYIREIK